MFERIFIEISNICNLDCSFCPKTQRSTKIMRPPEFRKILMQCAPLTEQVFLHIMGEPLLHPDFAEILAICKELKTKVQLTTNGTLIHGPYRSLLFDPIVRQINFSLQGIKDCGKVKNHILPILEFTKDLHRENPNTYINLRLWNLNADETTLTQDNEEEMQTIEQFYNISIKRNVEIGSIKSKKIWNRVYLHYDTKFVWPSLDNPHQGNRGTCHALSKQIGILADGKVVPCCLDKDGEMTLGNCLEVPLTDILSNLMAQAMLAGFKEGVLVQNLCQHCLYTKRFSKTI